MANEELLKLIEIIGPRMGERRVGCYDLHDDHMDVCNYIASVPQATQALEPSIRDMTRPVVRTEERELLGRKK